MSSGSKYKVKLSEEARQTLENLKNEDLSACKRLALLLMSLEKNPEPTGSRILLGEGEHSRQDERVWDHGEFRIAYRINLKERNVEVGIIRKSLED